MLPAKEHFATDFEATGAVRSAPTRTDLQSLQSRQPTTSRHLLLLNLPLTTMRPATPPSKTGKGGRSFSGGQATGKFSEALPLEGDSSRMSKMREERQTYIRAREATRKYRLSEILGPDSGVKKKRLHCASREFPFKHPRAMVWTLYAMGGLTRRTVV